MDNSPPDSTNNPSGFRYTDRNSPQQSSNRSTQDFISLSDTPAQNYNFSPSNYSSPQQFRGSPHKFFNKQRRYFGYENRSFSNNRSFNKSASFSGNRSGSFNISGGLRSFSGNFGGPHRNQNRRGWQDYRDGDTNQYIDRKCLEDPWLELEKEQAESASEQNETSKGSESSET